MMYEKRQQLAEFEKKLAEILEATLQLPPGALREDSGKCQDAQQCTHDALALLEANRIVLTQGRLDKLAGLLEELGHTRITIETVQRGSHMRQPPETSRKIGQMRDGKSSFDLWAVWENQDEQ